MEIQYLRKLGSEKINLITEDFDRINDKYRQLANCTGYNGELVFKKEKGKIVIFVKI